jgi:peptidoglycan-associated lipoprotein
MKVSKYAVMGLALSLAACGGSGIKAPSDLNDERVFFAFDSYAISGDTKDGLLGQSMYMKEKPTTKIQIAGNCDERGTAEYNLALGARRANAAKKVLVDDGIQAGRVKTISYGKDRPWKKGTGESVWESNRNAHTTVTSK